MAESQRLVQHGTSGSTPVYADVTHLGFSATVRVTLTANYTIVDPPGIPTRPSFTGAATVEYPHTIPSGTVLLLHGYEATALKAAGGGV